MQKKFKLSGIPFKALDKSFIACFAFPVSQALPASYTYIEELA